jgi:hypothetical protein
MKAAAFALAMMLAVTASNAQSMTTDHAYFSDATKFEPALIAQAEKGYVNCLKSDNAGVVESALGHVAMMKLALPARGFKDVESQIARLVKNAATPELRYKAYLTLVVMQHPEIFGSIGQTDYNGYDELFGKVSSRLCNYSSAR